MSENEFKLTEEQGRQIVQFLTTLFTSETCPWCHLPITDKTQMGRCIYAVPCGCRLYQGQLNEK